MTEYQTPRIAKSVEELLSYYDEEFIACAYHTILGRAPDQEGFTYYLARIRTGVAKLEILKQLMQSPEGKKKNVLEGLERVIKKDLNIRSIWSIFFNFFGLNYTDLTTKKINALENHLYIIKRNTRNELYDLEKKLHSVQKTIKSLEEVITLNPINSIASINNDGKESIINNQTAIPTVDPQINELKNKFTRFDSEYYKKTYLDVVEHGFEPLEHFNLFGKDEGRIPLVDNFDPDWYSEKYADVLSHGFDPYDHYVRFGKIEGRLPRAPFGFNNLPDQSPWEFMLSSWKEVNAFNENLYKTLDLEFAEYQLPALECIQQNTSSIEKEFIALLPSFDAITFDVFDTLVVREIVNPHDIFKLMEYELNALGIHIPNFALARIGAENQARAMSTAEEVTLDEIYDSLFKDYKIDVALQRKLKELEVNMEFTYLKPSKIGSKLFSLAKSAGKKIYLISDFYMNAQFIAELAQRCSYNDISKIYVSSELGLTKHTGNLFQHFLKSELINANRILHVGDNTHSDGAQAIRNGLASFLIPKNKELFFESQNKTLFNSDNSDKSISIAESIILGQIINKLTDAENVN